jgi:hypothetical protein
MGEPYQQQPLALTWVRVTAGASAAGKVIDALSAWTGENFRKGVCGTREDLLAKLADGVVALLCATQYVTKDQDITWAAISAAARKVCRRIAQQQPPGRQWLPGGCSRLTGPSPWRNCWRPSLSLMRTSTPGWASRTSSSRWPGPGPG